MFRVSGFTGSMLATIMFLANGADAEVDDFYKIPDLTCTVKHSERIDFDERTQVIPGNDSLLVRIRSQVLYVGTSELGVLTPFSGRGRGSEVATRFTVDFVDSPILYFDNHKGDYSELRFTMVGFHGVTIFRMACFDE